jgi:hypothetical protein
MDRAGYSLHVEPHAATVTANDDERLLTLLGMHRERAVREPESIRFVNDRDDPARDLDEADRERRAHRDIRADCQWSVGQDIESGTAVHHPTANRVATAIERVDTP